MQTLNFFGESGLTSTSANHIANLAKEAVRNAYEKLVSVRFYEERVALLASGKDAKICSGWNESLLNQLPAVVKLISDANSLIAWLREAIKEKERRMKEAQMWENKEGRAEISGRYKAFCAIKPVREPYPDEESLRQKWSVGEQEKYLSLEAEAAAIGKFVHEAGYLSRARIDLMKKVQNPSSIDLDGQNTIIHTYSPTVSVKMVDDVFNQFQVRHREVQAELNGMKKRIDDTIFAEKMRIDTEYAEALREWQAKDKEFAHELNVFDEEEMIQRNERVKAVQNLKIVIPNRLRPLYEQLQQK